MPFLCGTVRKSCLSFFLCCLYFPEKLLKPSTIQKMHGSLNLKCGLFAPKGRPTGSRAKKASPSAPVHGSVTVEAALVLPIFLFAMATLLFLIELISLSVIVHFAMYNAAKETASCGYAIEKAVYGGLPDGMGVSGITKSYLESKVDEELEPYADLCSRISGGHEGVSLSSSRYERQTGRLYMKASYEVPIPFRLSGVPALKFQSRLCAKLWNGYLGEGFSAGGEEEMVYITKTGTVYHRSADCTYLKLSIRSVSSAELDGLRNRSGGKYYPCEKCIKDGEAPASVYIANYGNRYHNSLSCSELKRYIRCVPLSQVGGRGPCSKCGGNER